MTSDVYTRSPLRFNNEIPVFSNEDNYTVNYEQISQDHLKTFLSEGRNPFMEEAHWLECENSTAELVQQYAKHGDKILDVGVGMGRLLSRFPDLERYGMDISYGYLEQARTKGIQVCYSRVEDMPYHEGMFDIVVCTDVLEHVLNLNEAFSKIISVLKEGGILIARVPYKEDLSSYLEPSCPYQFVHLRNFDEYELRILVERIFDLTWLQSTLTGYFHGFRLNYSLPFPMVHGLIRRALSEIRKISQTLFDSLVKKLYHPCEINFVVKKEPLRIRRGTATIHTQKASE